METKIEEVDQMQNHIEGERKLSRAIDEAYLYWRVKMITALKMHREFDLAAAVAMYENDVAASDLMSKAVNSRKVFEQIVAEFNAVEGLRRGRLERVYFYAAGPVIAVLAAINAYLTYLLVSKP